MSKTKDQAKSKSGRPEARLPKGLRDIASGEIRAMNAMLAAIREVYETYGFEPLETPAIEYTDALGKFLPDQDRPNEGVFSFQDEDEQWLSLRYDLTAPLARHVAEGLKSQSLGLPFRRYAVGPVWRNEKPGPGRFRQFIQFDADTVGAESVAADAEICMLAADAMEKLGLAGKYTIKVNNRKILDGLLQIVGIDPNSNEDNKKRLAILRSLDKLDKFKSEDIRLLLTTGRRDESGDFTEGAGLLSEQADLLIDFIGRSTELWVPPDQAVDSRVRIDADLRDIDGSGLLCVYDVYAALDAWEQELRDSPIGLQGVQELRSMQELWHSADYGTSRIRIDASVVRGLEYYTGPVFEAELTFEVKNEDGQTVRFGSVGGGGRYDGLVERFTGQKVPATGFSVGVSRLLAALTALNRTSEAASFGPVVVLVMDKAELPRFQRHAQVLRQAGIRAEMYLGSAGMKAQMKYADRRNAPCVVIQGGNEIAEGVVQIKDLIEGAKAAASIKDNKEWKESRPAQVSVPEADLVKTVRELLARHGGGV